MTTIDTHATGAAEPGAGLAGVADWLTTTDHKRIGRLYVGVSLVALVGSLVVAALLAAERISTSGTIVEFGSLTQLFAVYRFGLTYVVMLPLLLGLAVAVVLVVSTLSDRRAAPSAATPPPRTAQAPAAV